MPCHQRGYQEKTDLAAVASSIVQSAWVIHIDPGRGGCGVDVDLPEAIWRFP